MKVRPFILLLLSLVIIVLSGCNKKDNLDNNDTTVETINSAAFYHFDEVSGSEATDSSGNDLNGTLVGVSRVVGKKGNAVLCGAPDSRVELPAQGEFSSGQISLEAWIRFSTINNNATYQIVGGGTYGLQSYRLQVRDQKIEFLLDDNSSWQTVITANQALSANTWYYIALTFSGSEAKIYINGSQDNARNVSFPILGCYNTVYVGAKDTIGFSWESEFTGEIDELRICKLVRTADQIQAYYLETK
jgi:hypothetical protein